MGMTYADTFYTNHADEILDEILSSNGDFDGKVFARKMEEKKDKEINRLWAEIVQYESGHKGACPTCELVGELNVELKRELAKEREKARLLEVDCMASLNWRIAKEKEIRKLKEIIVSDSIKNRIG